MSTRLGLRSSVAFGILLVQACARGPSSEPQPATAQTTAPSESHTQAASDASTATPERVRAPTASAAGATAGSEAGARNAPDAAQPDASAAADSGIRNEDLDAGTSSAGATARPASSEQLIDSEGCPLDLEGFATLPLDTQPSTTGGAAGETVTVSDQAELSRYAAAAEPYVIRVQGALKLSPKGKEIEVGSNKTILGVGDAAEIVEGGFVLREGVHNVIIRNLTIHGSFVEGDWEGKTQDYDGVQMDTAHHVWIDHCHFHHIGDGMIDSRKDTTLLTVSWNILSDHNKAFGIGWTDNVTAQITVHHNWLRDTNQRNPSTDNVLRAHLYNNWLERIATYGNYARGGTHMVLENSVFASVKDPHYFDTGSLVAIGNHYMDTSGKRAATGDHYAAFDPHTFYAYTLTPTGEVTALLTRCAGPRPSLGQ